MSNNKTTLLGVPFKTLECRALAKPRQNTVIGVAPQATHCELCSAHYGDAGVCDRGMPVGSPHRASPTGRLTHCEPALQRLPIPGSESAQVRELEQAILETLQQEPPGRYRHVTLEREDHLKMPARELTLADIRVKLQALTTDAIRALNAGTPADLRRAKLLMLDAQLLGRAIRKHER